VLHLYRFDSTLREPRAVPLLLQVGASFELWEVRDPLHKILRCVAVTLQPSEEDFKALIEPELSIPASEGPQIRANTIRAQGITDKVGECILVELYRSLA